MSAAETIRQAENCMWPALLLIRDRIESQYRREYILRLQSKRASKLIWC
jgi:hypothetical protein